MTIRAARLVAVLVATVASVAACSAPADRSLPPPRSTSSTTPEPSTTVPDYSQIALTPVEGATTVPPLTERGDAAIRGVVTGPEGPLPDAIVRIERLVGDAVQRTEVRSAPDGRYEFVGVPGGRYRVRAYLPPTLTTAQTEIFYLVDGDERDLALATVPFDGLVVRGSTTPGAPTVGSGVNLAVRVAQREVDGEGIGRETPVAGVAVRVSASGWTSLDDDPRAVTDGQGVAVFQYRCDTAGQVSATAVVSVARPADPPGDDSGGGEPDDGAASPDVVDEVFPLDVPPCGPRPTTTTTTTTTTAPSSSSSSSSSSSTSSTTSTTAA